MQDKKLDEIVFRCPICRREYPGKYINNPHELTGICDWCAIGLMIKAQDIKSVIESN